MMGDDDRPAFLDREKKSFAELDRLRREGRGEARRPESGKRSKQASERALEQADALFAKSADKVRAQAVLDARGTPGLVAACRAYRAEVGLPREAALIGCFLDAGDAEVALAGIAGAREAWGASALEITPGLRTRLRMLADGVDDAVAEASETLLEEL